MIKELTKEEYKYHLSAYNNYHLVQSDLWDYYQAITYKSQVRIGYFSNGELKAVGRAINIRILRNKHIVQFNYGPIVKEDISETEIKEFVEELKAYFSKGSNIAVSISPTVFKPSYAENMSRLLKFLPASPLQIRKLTSTLIVDMNMDLEELYKTFRNDVRYNIRKFGRDHPEVTTKVIDTVQEYEVFSELNDKYKAQKGYVGLDKKIYKELLERKEGIIIAIYEKEELLSFSFICLYKEQKTVIVMTNVNTEKGLEIKSPTVLVYEMIKWATKNGFTKLDFFDAGSTKGIRDFKMGFTKNLINYPEEKVIIVDSFSFKIAILINKIKKVFKR